MMSQFNIKSIVLATCLFAFCFSAMAQVRRVTMTAKNITVKLAMAQLKKQTGYSFVFDANTIKNLKRRVNISAHNAPVSDVVAQILQGEDVEYVISGTTIAVKKKTAQRPTTQQKSNSSVTGNKVKITGRVVDEKGEPIIGATVKNSSNTGTVTDIDGYFTLSVTENSNISVSYIGYKDIDIKSANNMNIVLKSDTEDLDEVVVVGFGVQKKADLTGAVSSVKMKDILGDRSVATTGALLEGVIPGLQVTSSSGEPGVGFNYNIRGTTSINGGSPLILVDNVPFSGPLNLINPDDIESVTVLKDAASASIYGARSAFGVILITTKGANKEQKMTLTYSNNFTFSIPSSLPQKASPLETVQAYSDAGYVTYYSGQTVDTWLALLNNYQMHPSEYPDGFSFDNGVRYQLARTNVIKDFLSETGFQQNHNAAISGGSKKSSYRISLGYTGSDGIMTTNMDSYKRYNAKGFINAEITKWLTVQMDLSFYKSDKGMPSNANYSNAVWAPSYTPLGMIDVNGEKLYSGTVGNLTRLGGQNKVGITDTRLFTKFMSSPIKGLLLNFEFTHDNLNQTITNYSKRVLYANSSKFTEEYNLDASVYSQARSTTNYTAINTYGSYSKNFINHHLKLMLGYNQESSHYDYLSATTSHMINDDMPSISQSTGEQKAYDGVTEYTVQGFFGRFNYDYADKYLFEANGRYDASSKFPKHHRWGFFPSFSIGWRVSEESFMKSMQNTISNLKLRASIGSVGNQNISPYQFVPGMSSYKLTWLNNNTQPITLNRPGLVSGNFTWETVDTYNVGIDLGLLNNRLNLNVDWYTRYTRDMLTSGSQLPATLGTSAPLQNVADLKSYGFELELGWQDRIGKVRYNIGFNLYDYKAKIIKFKNNVAGVIRTSSNNTYVEGQRIGEIWGYVTDRFYTIDDFVEGSLDSNYKNGILKERIPHVEGVNPNPGDILYKDLDGNGIINSGNETINDPGDRKVIGNNSLRFQYGIRGGLSWNNISFSFLINGVGKCDKWLANDLIFPYYYEFGTIYSHQLNYWTTDRMNAKYPRLYETGYRNNNYAANIRCQTKYLTNGAYMRIKNLTLSYSLPHKFLGNLGVEDLRIYVSAENPFTFDHMPKGLDPTVTNTSSGLGYPVMSSCSFGFNLTL